GVGTDIFWPPANELADFFGVHVSTARRWRREQNAPRAVIMLLACDLGAFDPVWAGWRVRGGLLRSPEGLEAAMQDVRALPFIRMQVVTYQTENRKLVAQLESGIVEQPMPAEWDWDQLT